MSKYGKANNIVACMFKDVAVTIGVRFINQFAEPSGQVYTYKGWRSDNYQIDDYVVIESPNRGLVIAIVVRVDDFLDIDLDSDRTYEWVVQKIDYSAYDEHNRKEIALKTELQRSQQRKNQDEAANLLGDNFNLFHSMFKDRFESDSCDLDNDVAEFAKGIAYRSETHDPFAEARKKLMEDALKVDGKGIKILIHVTDEQIEKIQSGYHYVTIGRCNYNLLYCDLVAKVAVIRA